MLVSGKRIVIKLGTGILTRGPSGLDTDRIATLCNQINLLRERGIEVILVSSGAIGLGMGQLKLKKRPKDLTTLQACAAVGQSILINNWQHKFDRYGITVAQILLTREDLRVRHRHNAVFKTVECLLNRNIIPIVNENDTISASEIKFGDNDTLSALMAGVSHADMLFILSNIPGLIDMKGTGKVLPLVKTITPEIEAMAEDTQQNTSVGGMISKLSASKIAQRSGCGVLIADGTDPHLFERLILGEHSGTWFPPRPVPVKSKKRWIAIQDNTRGSIQIDAGAGKAILQGGKSLLAPGIVRCEGHFKAGDVVQICLEDSTVIAHGISSLDKNQVESGESPRDSNVVIHRDHLVLM